MGVFTLPKGSIAWCCYWVSLYFSRLIGSRCDVALVSVVVDVSISIELFDTKVGGVRVCVLFRAHKDMQAMYTVDSLHPSTILKKAEGGSRAAYRALGSGASTDNDASPRPAPARAPARRPLFSS